MSKSSYEFLFFQVNTTPLFPGDNIMSKTPSVPAPSPRASPNARPRSAPAPKKIAASSSVSVHGSEVMIAHTPANSKVFLGPNMCTVFS